MTEEDKISPFSFQTHHKYTEVRRSSLRSRCCKRFEAKQTSKRGEASQKTKHLSACSTARIECQVFQLRSLAVSIATWLHKQLAGSLLPRNRWDQVISVHLQSVRLS